MLKDRSFFRYIYNIIKNYKMKIQKIFVQIYEFNLSKISPSFELTSLIS